MGNPPKKSKQLKSTTKLMGKNLKPQSAVKVPQMQPVIPVPPNGVQSVLLSDGFGNLFWKTTQAAEAYLKGDNADGFFWSVI